MQSYHSKNYAITVLSRPTTTVSKQTILPIYDHGGPPHSPKTTRNKPQTNRFSLATSNVIRLQSYHSKNDYAITVLSQPTSTVSRHTISPICDHEGPSHSPKTGRNATQTTTFLFVDALSGLILHFPVFRTIFNTIFFCFCLKQCQIHIKIGSMWCEVAIKQYH